MLGKETKRIDRRDRSTVIPRLLPLSSHHNFLSQTMLRSTLLLSLLSTLALASPLALKPDQMVLNGVSWGANKLSSIGTTDGGDTVRTMTKWDWNDCGQSHSYSYSRERG